tara:strand:- start:187 stop:423 length:237 start_codon:yes stop_codon:yes gene_type:complete
MKLTENQKKYFNYLLSLRILELSEAIADRKLNKDLHYLRRQLRELTLASQIFNRIDEEPPFELTINELFEDIIKQEGK